MARRKWTLRTALAVAGLSVATLLPTTPAVAAPTQYVTISDGTSIAINMQMPEDYVEGKSYPTIFEMSGYDGGSSDGTTPFGLVGDGSRGITAPYEKDYITIHASVRGTGCSSGEFDLFSWRSALDGREVVERIADQPWSNGKVGIYGHSYGGITGTMIAATRPPHLTAVTVSGLIDDMYRGMVYPGGVSNYGFPLLWTGLIRNIYDVGGGTYPGLAAGDLQCAANVATHRRVVVNDPIIQGLADTDNTWFQSRSLINYVERIEVPVHISGANQDEQTGPRGPYHLWEALQGVPKRLMMSNGDHGTQTNPEFQADRLAWMDHWIRGEDNGFGSWKPGRKRTPTSVVSLFETQGGQSGGRVVSKTFPLENTQWKNVYLHEGGALDFQPPTGAEASDMYVSGSPRGSWSFQAGDELGPPLTTEDGPDELTYTSAAFDEPTALSGPITATIFSSATATDTEFFVQLIDEGPDGSRQYLQRGMLKASHRAIDRGLSDKLAGGTIYRPYRPHTNPTDITPLEINEYLIEVFPLTWVFRPGHRLVVKIHTPPLVDSFNAYVPKRLPGINTIYHDPEHPSHLMLPFVPVEANDLGPEPGPCSLDAVRCVP